MTELNRQYIAVTVGDKLAYKSWSDVPGEDGFTIDFDLTRTNKGEPNKGTVIITNPSESDALALVQAKTRPLIRVLFGWQSTGLQLVGGGNAEKDGVKLTYAGADTQLAIGFLDGIAALRGSYLALKFPKGTPMSAVVQQAIFASGLPSGVVLIDPEDDYPLPKSYTVEGGALDALERLARTLRADFSVQDGKVNFVGRKLTTPAQAPVFSTANGRLIGRPEPRGRDGAVFNVVACPELLPGGRFLVEYAGLFGSGVWKCTSNKTSAGKYKAGISTIEAKASKR
jgi:hypothetical protein